MLRWSLIKHSVFVEFHSGMLWTRYWGQLTDWSFTVEIISSIASLHATSWVSYRSLLIVICKSVERRLTVSYHGAPLPTTSHCSGWFSEVACRIHFMVLFIALFRVTQTTIFIVLVLSAAEQYLGINFGLHVSCRGIRDDSRWHSSSWHIAHRIWRKGSDVLESAFRKVVALFGVLAIKFDCSLSWVCDFREYVTFYWLCLTESLWNSCCSVAILDTKIRISGQCLSKVGPIEQLLRIPLHLDAYFLLTLNSTTTLRNVVLSKYIVDKHNFPTALAGVHGLNYSGSVRIFRWVTRRRVEHVVHI